MGGQQQGLARLTAVLAAAGLTEQETADANAIIEKSKEKATALQTAAAWTDEQRGSAPAMTTIRRQTPPPTGAALTEALNKELKASDAQVKAQKDLAALVSRCS